MSSGGGNRGIRIEKTAVVCSDTTITGDVSIGAGTVIHPKATITATPSTFIAIGQNNIIHERVHLSSCHEGGLRKEQKLASLRIGSNNVFEVGSQIFCSKIGNSNIIEAKAVVSEGVVIEDGCIIGMGVLVPPHQVVKSNTIIFGPDSSVQQLPPNSVDNHLATHMRHLDTLWNLLPKFHQLKT